MRRAARSYRDARDANSNPGPCGPLPALPHRHRPASPGIARQHLGERIAALADPPTAQHQATLAHRLRHPPRPRRRRRPHQRLVLCDRVLATLIVPRRQLPHQTLAVLLGSTAPPSPAPSARSARCWPPPGLRRARPAHAAPADLGGGGADAAANGVQLRIHGTQTQVRRPHAHRPGRRAFLLRQAQAAAPSSPPWSATARAAPCGPGRCARAASTTRPRSTPRASPTC
jgi:hypothetical protein